MKYYLQIVLVSFILDIGGKVVYDYVATPKLPFENQYIDFQSLKSSMVQILNIYHEGLVELIFSYWEGLIFGFEI